MKNNIKYLKKFLRIKNSVWRTMDYTSILLSDLQWDPTSCDVIETNRDTLSESFFEVEVFGDNSNNNKDSTNTAVASETVKCEKYRIKIDRDINAKVHLYAGAIWKLSANCYVLGQNENLSDRAEYNNPIIDLAGPDFEANMLQNGNIITGSSAIFQGGNLSCDYVIYSVGPKYDPKYISASEYALFSAYKSALAYASVPSSPSIKVLALSTIYLQKKNYPREEAAHTALRTVRKYLEHKITIEKIVFCVHTEEDLGIYKKLLQVYFPRNENDLLLQDSLLPTNLGDEWGELVIEERTLKITSGPKPITPIVNNRKILNDHDVIGSSPSVRRLSDNVSENASPPTSGSKPRGMNEYVEHYDRITVTNVDKPITSPKIVDDNKIILNDDDESLEMAYDRMAKIAVSEEYEDIAALNFIQVVGKDRLDRYIVWITAANLPVPRINQKRIIYYILKVMESLRCLPYVLVYAYSGISNDNIPKSAVVEVIFDIFYVRYRASLQQFYLLHPTIWLRMYMTIGFPSNAFWKDYKVVKSLKSLNGFIDTSTIDIPPVVRQYDLNIS